MCSVTADIGCDITAYQKNIFCKKKNTFTNPSYKNYIPL